MRMSRYVNRVKPISFYPSFQSPGGGEIPHEATSPRSSNGPRADARRLERRQAGEQRAPVDGSSGTRSFRGGRAMRRIAAVVLVLILASCATGSGTNQQTTAENRPRQPSIIEEMGQAGGGGY